MSNFFRDLTNQGAQSSTQNTQWWLNQTDPSTITRLEEKQKSGATLTPEEEASLKGAKAYQEAYAREQAGTATEKDKATLGVFRHFEDKAKKQGIEKPNTVSTSTGVPDLTDKQAQARKMSQALQGVSGRGRRASMLNGEYDDSMLGGF